MHRGKGDRSMGKGDRSMNGSVENDLSPFLPVFTEREIGDRSTSSTVWGQVRGILRGQVSV